MYYCRWLRILLDSLLLLYWLVVVPLLLLRSVVSSNILHTILFFLLLFFVAAVPCSFFRSFFCSLFVELSFSFFDRSFVPLGFYSRFFMSINEHVHVLFYMSFIDSVFFLYISFAPCSLRAFIWIELFFCDGEIKSNLIDPTKSKEPLNWTM